MSSADFLQDYIEEVREHLQDMEKSLLILEQEGANQEHIAEVFRAAHSIKGASAYIGFEGLANLTHELESLISGVQQKSGAIPSSGITLMLECVDVISGAVEHVKQTGMEPEIDSHFLDNLRCAFTGEGLFAEGAEAAPEAGGGFASGNGKDPGGIVFALEEDFSLEGIPEPDAFSMDERAAAPPGAEEDEYSPGERAAMGLDAEEGPEEAHFAGEEEPEFALEEDEELFSIFVGTFRENFLKLRQFLLSPAGDSMGTESRRTVEMLTEKLISSARYMDYEPIERSLFEWEKFLESSDGMGRSELIVRLDACGEELDKMMPALELYKSEGTEAASRADSMEEEDEELLEIFVSSFRENYTEILQLLSHSELGADEIEAVRELTSSLIRSCEYMDYEDLSGLLNVWEDYLTNWPGGEGEVDELRGQFSALGKELQGRLPGVELPDFPESAPEASAPPEKPDAPSLNLDEVIDDFFDLAVNTGGMSTIEEHVAFVAPVEEPSEPILVQGAEPDLPEFEPESEEAGDAGKEVALIGGETRPAMARPVSRALEPGKTPPGKERVVVTAEDVPHSTATLRVDAQKVDQLLNQVGELVVSRSEFIQTTILFRDILRDIASQGVLPKIELRRLRLLNFRLNESTQSLGRVTNDLQSSIMRVRMLPILQLFQRFPRIVRDQALKQGKKVELIVEGGETEIDKRVLEQMNDPLVQFLRNAIVHGIESPTERKAAGKPETGVIRLAAYHAGDYVAIEVEDDGRGIDTPKLREMLSVRQDISQHEVDKLTDQEVLYSIFMPGISTYDKVDGAAGRGVGLDVVKENVERMNGSIEVESYPGQGTRFMIRIPLTVAIIRALLVREADQIFTLPLTSVTEILRYRPETTHTIEGFRVINLRGKTIPIVNLSQLLEMGATGKESDHRFIVIVSTSFREVGLVVDGLMGEREVVIKSIENSYHPIEGFSGATILGDGRVSLIVDVSALLRKMKSTTTRQAGDHLIH